MPRTRPPYPKEFRERIIEVARAGRPASKLAKEFESCYGTIRSWIKQADRDAGRRSDGATTAEREQLRKLRKELRRLKQERDIVAKAAAWFVAEPSFARETIAIRQRSSHS